MTSTRSARSCMSQMPISLEKSIGEDDDSSLGDFVPDEQAESPFDTASPPRREDVEPAPPPSPSASAA